jgi:adenine-specific DNA-methyltransferase
MNSKYKKLELCWPGKDIEVKPEPRVLIEDPEKSYGEAETENMLIHADNLLALKALEQNFSGKIKCVYIDPPYNTGNAFEHYDDGLEHSLWLDLMHQRINILKKLLAKDGFFCCHIDDSEGAYLKVLLDEIFGRKNYLTTFFIRVRYPDKTLKQDMNFHKEIEQVHIYRKEFGAKPNLNQSKITFDKFNFFISENGKGKEIELGGKKVIIFQKGEYKIDKQKTGTEFGLKEIWATGSILDGNSSGRFFRDYLTGRYKTDGLGVLYKVYGIGEDRYDYRYFTGPQRVGATKGKYFQGVPVDKLESETSMKETPINNFYDLAGSFGNCRSEGGVDFRSGKKPEKLLNLIINHFSNEGDWVLDSFLGSGSTMAVAHKMNRKWIGIELGNHANTHCLPRIKAICEGADQTGISKEVNWQGGGGFKFYNLAPSLLNQDKYNQWVINHNYNADLLAAAMARHEGFKYLPNESIVWKQGFATENHFIFTTTNTITPDVVEQILSEMKPDESLRICCTAFIDGCNEISNRIEIKKIPEVLLGKCEFGKEDYCTDSNIINMPADPDKPDFIPSYVKPDVKPEPANIKKDTPTQTKLLF